MEGGINHHDSSHFTEIHVISLAVTGLIQTPPSLSLGPDINDLCELNKEVLIWQPFTDYKQTVSQSHNRTDFPPTLSSLPSPALVASDL